jgi:hypothetical protein
MKEALQRALDALGPTPPECCGCQAEWQIAIDAIKEALAQPEQEPVAWEQFYPEMGKPKLAYLPLSESPDNACYTPPQRTWVGLTDEEIEVLAKKHNGIFYDCDIAFARAIEATLKEKNT